jgi:ABC-type amino acid transport substrate-binding protein
MARDFREEAHMRARALTLPVVALALSFRAGAGADLPEVEKRGTLRVLVSADEAPEAFSLEEGGAPGFDRELLEGFARLHRVRLEPIVVKRFAEMIPRLKAGEGDLISGILVTGARRREIDFTDEVLPARLVIVTREPRPALVTVGALSAETVGVIPGNAWAQGVAEAGVPPERTVSFADVPALLRGLGEGSITATVMSVVDFTMAKRRDQALRAGAFVGRPGSGAWGVRPSDAALRRALDEYLSGRPLPYGSFVSLARGPGASIARAIRSGS